ncbi:ig-like domain-containing protein [Trichonephila clavata]|uniref:Ig-like domain-containing protein n=1 Tax=Trichonephila clavata TaxID=2740835 RepID=A0A8X6M3C3_TRICU|nr:ig-like domain-containing protein [Trichonephila clavata]
MEPASQRKFNQEMLRVSSAGESDDLWILAKKDASLAIGLLFCLVQPNSGYYQGNGDIQNEYVRTGSNATLVCQPAADVDNVNRLVWFKEDKKIAEVVNGRRTFWDAGPHVNLQPHNNALYFRRVTYPDSGEYSCEVNGKRTRNSIARLLVQGKSIFFTELIELVPHLIYSRNGMGVCELT